MAPIQKTLALPFSVKSPFQGGFVTGGFVTRGDFIATGLRQRFQGALIGLALAPALTANADSNATRAMVEVDKCFQQWEAVPDFLQCPQHTDEPMSLIASVPILLRCHDQPWRTRHRYVQTVLKGDAIAAAQQWVLSDVLAKLLGPIPGAASEIDPAAWAQSDAPARDCLPAYHHHYQGLWNAVLEKSPIYQEFLTSHEKDCHQAVITGISAALLAIGAQPSIDISYGRQACVAQAAIDSQAASSPSLSPSALSSPEFLQGSSSSTNWQISPLVGLILGAACGRSGLPVLWQTQGLRGYDSPSLSKIIAVANDLFAHWSGSLA
ncbi:MAG: hypothetical protein ACFB16_16470 [Phormidesmis sp.]